MAMIRRWDAAAGLLQLSTLRKALEAEGMITAWWSDVPGTHIAEHAHHFPETRWILSGFLRVTVSGEVIDLGPGDRLDIPAGMTHASDVIGLAPAIYVTGTTERTVEPAGVSR